MACFSITVKISAILLFFTGAYSLYLNRKEIIKAPKFLVIVFLIISLFITKNIFQTAYPFYPLKALSINQLDWKTPEPLIDYFLHGIKSWSYSDEYKPSLVENEYNQSIVHQFLMLLGRPGLKGLINKLIFCTAIIALIVFIRDRIRNKISNRETIVILFGILNFVIWFLFAPQYRFILPVFVFFFSLLLYYSFKIRLNNYNDFFINSVIVIYSIMFLATLLGINFLSSSTSKEIGQIDKLNYEKLIIPAQQYFFEESDSILINNTYYYHPRKNRYCWNGKLPCMSAGYEKVMWNDFKLRIAQRTSSLKDGFSINNH